LLIFATTRGQRWKDASSKFHSLLWKDELFSWFMHTINSDKSRLTTRRTGLREFEGTGRHWHNTE
ncbi:unnamed protein product, partial [Sphenostylis stenocarpa]